MAPKQHRVSKGKQPNDDPSQCCLPWLGPNMGGSEEGITQAPKTNLLSPQSPERKMPGWMGKCFLPPKPLAFSAGAVSGQASTGQALKWCEKSAEVQGQTERTRRKSQRSRRREADLGSYYETHVAFTQGPFLKWEWYSGWHTVKLNK